MNKVAIILAGTLFLSACATPYEICVSDASQEYRTLTAAITEARGNIDRGYAVHSQQVTYTYVGLCYTDGSSYPCPMTGYRTEETPVAIDVAEERLKLKRLTNRLPAVRERQQTEINACAPLAQS